MRNSYSSSLGTIHRPRDVTDWVRVPGNAVDYDDNPDANVWGFIEDSANGGTPIRLRPERRPQRSTPYLAQFDSGGETHIREEQRAWEEKYDKPQYPP